VPRQEGIEFTVGNDVIVSGGAGVSYLAAAGDLEQLLLGSATFRLGRHLPLGIKGRQNPAGGPQESQTCCEQQD
jgi:hypothetical protein